MGLSSTTQFEDVFLQSNNRVGICVGLLLAWLAHSDGRVAEEEQRAIDTVVQSLGGNAVRAINDAASRQSIRDIQLACEVVMQLDQEGRKLLLQMALGTALADGRLVTPENHILRFLADVAGVGEPGLQILFREMIGHDYPRPSDVSMVEWWHRQESSANNSKSDSGGGRTHARSSQGNVFDVQLIKDLAVLGLDEGATLDDIRAAYRRMAKVHHPDRYVSLGSEAVAAAEVTFRRIQQAYTRLGGA